MSSECKRRKSLSQAVVERWRVADHLLARTIVEHEAAKTPLERKRCVQRRKFFVPKGAGCALTFLLVHAQASRPRLILVKEARA